MNDEGRRVLLVVDRSVDGVERLPPVAQWLLTQAAGRVDVVAPVLSGRLDWLTGDTREDAALAQRRVETVVRVLEENGVDARGDIGDEDPLGTVIASAAREEYDTIVVLAPHDDDATWREHALSERVRQEVAVPVMEIVVLADGSVAVG